MLGLPTETDEDIEGIAHLTRLALHRYRLLPKEKRRRPLSITVSTASFVPKADTPFQWCPQLDVAELMRRQQLLRGLLKAQGVKYSWHDAQLSHIEAVFARGGRALSAVLLHAWRAGCRFDGWSDHFDYTRWLAAFEAAGVDPAFYANRQYGADERLPWDHIHCGVDKAFLRAEYDCALRGRTTPDCRQGCLACGLLAQCPLAGGDA